MKILVKGLRIFGYAWTYLVIGTIGFSIFGMIITSDTLGDAFHRITSTFSPFNIWNWIFTVICLLPAIGAFVLAQKIEK